MLNPVRCIVKKRDGAELSDDEIAGFVKGVSNGQVADYQLSAWLMAIYFRGMTDRETSALLNAMLHSGQVLELSSVTAPKIDKHSTGGVGDKISICLGPLVAACGVAVPMISGRGLGHTGGTLDKLEAIPGYRVHLGTREFERTVRTVGVSLIGQTEKLAPADRHMYALRDVTGTVESIPLIVASILSKKLAAGLDGLVLDVKTGRGAFMKEQTQAETLARALVRVGVRAGKRVVALITDMQSPIGLTIGNALETREAIEVLQGQGPQDTRELTLALGVEMLLLGKIATDRRAARMRLERALADGSGMERLLSMVRAHGGDPKAVEQPGRLPRARTRLPVVAKRRGVVTGIDPLALGQASVGVGAGRMRADQNVDPAAGIEIATPIGTTVSRGEPLAWIHAPSAARAEAELERVRGAFSIGERANPSKSRVLKRIVSREAR